MRSYRILRREKSLTARRVSRRQNLNRLLQTRPQIHVHFTRYARVNLSSNAIANPERPFWEINQSYCEKVIDNACSFVPRFWSPSEINAFFGVACILIDNDIRHHGGQNLLWIHEEHESTTFWPLSWRVSLIVDKSTNSAEPLSIC